MPKMTILVTGMILIFVEAFSMGAGSFISEHSAQEYAKKKNNDRQTTSASLVMFVSYFIAGLIPIFPYLIMDIELAFWVSISASVLGLGLLGFINAKIYNTKVFHHAFEMLLIGGVAIGVGTLVGKLADMLIK
ncbi:MAG: hypothetical protein COU51_00905 [Parcubacteria group bacterium CG10_big_fil_rev_8_21_14_0_10_36_14]|nr:MAG: hypothetical protein COU51_00905 [Parcubacteria group bacterium CG10_big_fil_rev_8_21_14_0_10_36_14]